MKLAAALVLAVFAIGSRGTTPQSAAKSFLSAGSPNLKIVRVNQRGGFALVATEGARIEGNPITWPILVQQYPFGWQVVGWIAHPCDVIARVGNPSDAGALLAGMTVPADTAADCAYTLTTKDFGPSADVAAIRAIAEGPVIFSVVVHGNYGFAQWAGAGGGGEVFARTDGTWKMTSHGGGAYATSNLVQAGVPQSEACALFKLAYRQKECH
jgi:hypothetical protein